MAEIELDNDIEISITLYETVQAHTFAGHGEPMLSKFYNWLSQPKVVGEEEKQKEVNGLFVSGKVNGHRNDDNVEHKNILVLDVDDLPPGYDLYDSFSNQFKFAFAMYSTWSHTEDNGRYRLLIPINRNISKEQYRVMVKQLVNHFQIPGIDAVSDRASHSFARPIIANENSPFVFKYQDAPVMELTDENLNALDREATKMIKASGYKPAMGSGEWNDILSAKSEGEGRNEAMTKLLGHLLRRYVDVNIAYTLISLWNDRHSPPMSQDEFKTCFNSIYKKEMRRRADKS